MPGEDKILSEEHRAKLDGIVQQMTANKEPDENIHAVVEDFKSKYSVPVKKKVEASQSPLVSTQPLVQQPSLSDGGTSGLTSTPSVLQNNQTPNDFGDFNKGLLGDQPITPVTQPKSITAGQNVPEGNLMAATSSAETTAKDQNNFNQELTKKGLQKGDLTESLMRGTANLASSVLKTPAFLYDVATAMQHPMVKEALDKIHMGSSQQISDATGIKNEVANDLDTAVNHSQKIFQEKYDKPVTEYISNGDYDKAFGLMANSVVESAPAMIAIAAGGIGGASMLETTVAGTGVFGANKMSQLDEENPDMDHATKVGNALGTGALEGITEALPVGKLASLTKNVLLKSGEEAAKEFAKQGFMKTASKAMARYFGVQSTEAISEMANQFGENVLDKLTGAKPDIKLSDGVVDAGILGFGTGVAMTGPTSALELVKTRQAVKKAGELADQKKTLEADLISPNVSDDVKSHISDKIKDINEQESVLANEEKQKFNDLPEDKKSEVDALLLQAKKMSDTITDPTISEQTREVMKKDHEEIEKNIDKVFEESEKIKADKQKEQATNDEWMKSFEQGLGPETGKEKIAPNPESQEAAKKTPIQDVVEKENRTLPEDQKAIETKFAKDLDENYEERKKEYLEKNGNVFDTDRARELSEDYKQNPANLSNSVHVPAREFVTRLYKEELAKKPPEGNSNTVSFTSGGSGAGKSSMVDKAKGLKSHLIVDTNLSNTENAKSDIQEALDAGKKVKIHFIYRDPVQAFMEGVVGGKNRGGRTVPVEIANKANKGSLETIKELSDFYKDNKNVKIYYYNNTGKKGKAKPFSLNDVKAIKVDYKQAEKEIQDELTKQYQEGKLTDDQYRGFSGKTELPTRNDTGGEGLGKGMSGGARSNVKSTEQLTQKKDTNAIKKGIVTESDQQQYQNGNESRQASKTSNSDSNEQSGEIKSEKEKVVSSKELIDEQEQIESQGDDDKASVDKLNSDIEVLKKFKDPDIAGKKFKAILERAFKMKEEGKIKKPTYTKYRNIAQEVLGPKVSVDAEEKKYKIETFKEEVKKKLLGEGYKKVLMSAPGFGPKQVADLIDLTAVAAQKAIDAGYTVKEAVERALIHIKKHPYYSKLVDEGHLKEADFNSAVTDKFNQAEQKAETAEKVKQSKSKKNQAAEGDIFGETRKKKTAARAESSINYQDVVSEMDEDEKFYKSINVKKANEHIDKILDKMEEGNHLEGLANKIINDKHPFNEKIQNLASAKLADRLRVIAQKEGNEMQKSAINKLAAKLIVSKNRNTNVAATQTALEAEVAKLMPISEEGLKDFVNASIGDIQNTYLSDQQQSDINEFAKAVQEAVNEELNKIAEGTKGKEWVISVDNAIDSLKIDLTDC